MPGGLESYQEEDEPLGGGLSLATQMDPLKSATAAFRRDAQRLPPDSSGIDAFAQRANGAYPSWAEMKQRMEREIQAQGAAGDQALDTLRHPNIDQSLPWLRAAAGMLKPTRTGSFGESLGSGLEGYVAGKDEQQKTQLDFSRRAAELGYLTAKDKTASVEGMLKLGMSAEQIEAALAMMKNRLAAQRYKIVPTRGLVDLMAPNGPAMVPGMQTLTLAQLQTQIQKNIDRYISQQKVFTDPRQADAERKRLYDLATEQLSNDPDSVFGLLVKPGGASRVGLPSGAQVTEESPRAPRQRQLARHQRPPRPWQHRMVHRQRRGQPARPPGPRPACLRRAARSSGRR